MALTKQPKQIKTVAELARFTEMAERRPVSVLAAEFKISEQTARRYLHCLREGQKLTLSGYYDTQKYSAEELSDRHAGRKICLPWGVVSPPVPHSFIEHR